MKKRPKTLAECGDELRTSLNELKLAILNQFEWLFRPIVIYLACESSITQIKACVSPKYHKQVDVLRKMSRGIPRDLRGAFLSGVLLEVQSGSTLYEAISTAVDMIFIVQMEAENGNDTKCDT